MILVILQNAWSPVYAGGKWPRESWLRALSRSRSGCRLTQLLGDDYLDRDDVWLDNTTPIVGATPGSLVPPDETHLRRLFEVHKPRLVVACGKQASRVCRGLWSGRLLAVPHPAYRLLTNETYQELARTIREVHAEEVAS